MNINWKLKKKKEIIRFMMKFLLKKTQQEYINNTDNFNYYLNQNYR